MKLTDEDVDRIAEALAKKLPRVTVFPPSPYVPPQPNWYWWQYPNYAYPTVYCSSVTATSTGTLIN